MELNPNKKIKTFSKGMKKQAMFILTLSIMPDYLLLDEPLDGLDPVIRKYVKQYIVNDVCDRNMTVIISSHDLKELEGLCDTIGIISDQGNMKLEKAIDNISGHFNKIQVSFGSKAVDNSIYNGLNIIGHKRTGSIDMLVVNNDAISINKFFDNLEKQPVILDLIPLTLEETFIYEMGGEQNDDQISIL